MSGNRSNNSCNFTVRLFPNVDLCFTSTNSLIYVKSLRRPHASSEHSRHLVFDFSENYIAIPVGLDSPIHLSIHLIPDWRVWHVASFIWQNIVIEMQRFQVFTG